MTSLKDVTKHGAWKVNTANGVKRLYIGWRNTNNLRGI
jgi:hypothetical protein